MKHRPNRKRNQQGFTLSEMLCSIVVLLLLTGIATVCVNLASLTYRRTMREAEARTLCSTLSSAAEAELRYATNIVSTGSFCSDFGQGGFAVSDGHVTLAGSPLLSDMCYPYDLSGSVTVTDYDKDENRFTVEVAVTYGSDTLAEDSFTVTALN